MKQYNILVFPCGTEIANEILNSLTNHKYFNVILASSEKNSYCNFRNININYIPYVDDFLFKSKLLNIIDKQNIDFIIPAHDDVAYQLSIIPEIESMIIGQNSFINNIVRFKDKTYEYFKDTSLIANTYQTEKDIIFPCFTKPKKGQGAKNAFLLKDIQEYKIFLQSYDKNKFIFMEFLNGDEFTIDCFSHNGEILYSGARTREKMIRGIAVQSTYVNNDILQKKFFKFASIINNKLKLQGIWFFQMKLNKDNELKLLEIGPRVSGSMMLNRSRGINFVELAIYQKLKFDVEIIYNNIEISLARALVPIYKHNIQFDILYVDFDDTLLIDEKYINSNLIKLIFQTKNKDKKVILITKNNKNNLSKILHKFGITNIFDDIIHINKNDNKVNYMKENSLLIDDSFLERKKAILSGFYALGIDNLNVIIKD